MKKTEEQKQKEIFSVNPDEEKGQKFDKKTKKIQIENSNNQLFFRQHFELTNPDVKIVVLEPNKCVIYKDGVSSGILDGGNHQLYSEDEIKRGLFRKRKLKEPILVDIVVYNPTLTYHGYWGTPNPIPYRDPETEIPVDFKGRGEFEIRIVDIEKFHTTLVGSSKDFSMQSLHERLKTFILQEIRHEFASVVNSLHLGYIDITSHEKEIADAIVTVLSDKLISEYGLSMPQLVVEEFTIDEQKRSEIEEYLKNNRNEIKFKKDAKELAAEIERLDDKQWERDKYLIGLKREDYAKYLEVIKILGQAKFSQPAPAANPHNHFCPGCGAEVESDSAFCPKCGHQLKSVDKVCRHCGKVVKTKGKFCPHCGKEL